MFHLSSRTWKMLQLSVNCSTKYGKRDILFIIESFLSLGLARDRDHWAMIFFSRRKTLGCMCIMLNLPLFPWIFIWPYDDSLIDLFVFLSVFPILSPSSTICHLTLSAFLLIKTPCHCTGLFFLKHESNL